MFTTLRHARKLPGDSESEEDGTSASELNNTPPPAKHRHRLPPPDQCPPLPPPPPPPPSTPATSLLQTSALTPAKPIQQTSAHTPTTPILQTSDRETGLQSESEPQGLFATYIQLHICDHLLSMPKLLFLRKTVIFVKICVVPFFGTLGTNRLYTAFLNIHVQALSENHTVANFNLRM